MTTFTITPADRTTPAPHYPRLMSLREDPSCVVLFTANRAGYPIRDNGVGDHEEGWMDISNWVPFVGTIEVTQ